MGLLRAGPAVGGSGTRGERLLYAVAGGTALLHCWRSPNSAPASRRGRAAAVHLRLLVVPAGHLPRCAPGCWCRCTPRLRPGARECAFLALWCWSPAARCCSPRGHRVFAGEQHAVVARVAAARQQCPADGRHAGGAAGHPAAAGAQTASWAALVGELFFNTMSPLMVPCPCCWGGPLVLGADPQISGNCCSPPPFPTGAVGTLPWLLEDKIGRHDGGGDGYTCWIAVLAVAVKPYSASSGHENLSQPGEWRRRTSAGGDDYRHAPSARITA